MKTPLIVVTGTGTGIGKTHLAASLILAWSHVLREQGVLEPKVAGIKPVETGVSPGVVGDTDTLERVSTFHVKRFPSPYLLTRPVSPHLAALEEGRTIELAVIRTHVNDVRNAEPHGVLVELAGGLFTPLAPSLCNGDVVRALVPDLVVLVAPDRLGVLHEIAATTRAAAASNIPVTGIFLVTPAVLDASSGTNATELRRIASTPVFGVLPRGEINDLARHPELRALVSRVQIAATA